MCPILRARVGKMRKERCQMCGRVRGKSLYAHMCRQSIIDANLRRLHGGFESALHQLARLVVGQILAHDYLHHDADELAQT